jgi:F-type H+-transporting ATPase subunit b
MNRLIPALLGLVLTLALAPATWAAGPAVEADHAAGEPTLVQGFNEGLVTAVTTLIVFLLLVAILGKFAWGPIASGLKAREDKIRRDIADAEAARARAEATLKEYQAQLAQAESKVRELLSKAQSDAERVATSIRMQAQQEAEEAKERAGKEIEAAKNQALSEIYEQTASISTSIAEKILRRNLNADDQRELVRQSLEQLQAVAKN